MRSEILMLLLTGAAYGCVDRTLTNGDPWPGAAWKERREGPMDWALLLEWIISSATCNTYEVKNWCSQYGGDEKYRIEGMNANDACCTCGGGSGPNWRYGPWSDCNEGEQTRSADCVDNEGNPADNWRCPAVKNTKECVLCYSGHPAAALQKKACGMEQCHVLCRDTYNKQYSLVSWQDKMFLPPLAYFRGLENDQCKFTSVLYQTEMSVDALNCYCADELPSTPQTRCFKNLGQTGDQAHYYRTSLDWQRAWKNIGEQTAEFSTVDGWDGQGCPKYQQFMATCADKCSSPSVEDTAAICGEFKACLADFPAEVKALAMEGCPASTGSSALNASAAYLVGPSALVLLLLQVALLAR